MCTKTLFTPRLTMKKHTLAQDAFKLYAEKFMSLENIARQLHLNERTLRRWKKSDDWETKRTEYLRTKTTLHSDLYDFTRSLINSIERDMPCNCTFCLDNYCQHYFTKVQTGIIVSSSDYFLFLCNIYDYC